MAVTAKFLADFADFHAAVTKADVQLKEMETGANKVSASLSRMTDTLSGRKLIQDATLAAEAVERIGGTSKLTAAELSRVQAQASAAAEKLRAMGQDVPIGIQKIAAGAKTAGTALDSMKSIAGTLAATMGVAFSVGAVVSFGKKVFDTASQIHDLSSKLGISTDAVQGFKHAAEQSGASLDSVGTAINKMNANLAGGDKATVKALKDVGLSFDHIRSLKPEDAFLEIADAIQKIPDPMTQADVALQLFGKGAADLLPGMKEGFRGLAASADKMSEDTINSLEAAQDAWDRLANKVTIVTGTIIGQTLNVTKQVTSSWSNFLMFAENVIKFGTGTAIQMAEAVQRGTDAAAKNRDIHLALAPAVTKTGEAKKTAVKVIQEKTVATTEETHALQLFTEATKRANAELKYQEEIGRKQLAALGDYAGRLPTAIFQTRSFAGSIAMVSSEAAKFQGNLAGMAKTTGLAEKMFGTAADFGKNLGATIMGAIQGGGNPIAAAAGMVGQQITTHIAKSLSDGLGKELTGILGGAVSAILPGVGALLGPLISKIASAFDRNKGRDIVKEFAEGFGGFDALHVQLNTLGAEGEQLWIKLTQGVGRNNPDQARVAVALVTKALEDQKLAQADVKKAAEDTTAAQVLGNEKALTAMKALDDEIASLVKSIENEAPEEFIGIVEQQTRARIEALKKEREEASRTLESLTGTMTDSIKDVAEAIRTLPEKIRIELDVTRSDGGGSALTTWTGASPGASRAVPAVRGGDSAAMMAEQLAIQNNFMLVEMPKAITAAIQKAGA